MRCLHFCEILSNIHDFNLAEQSFFHTDFDATLKDGLRRRRESGQPCSWRRRRGITPTETLEQKTLRQITLCGTETAGSGSLQFWAWRFILLFLIHYRITARAQLSAVPKWNSSHGKSRRESTRHFAIKAITKAHAFAAGIAAHAILRHFGRNLTLWTIPCYRPT